MAWFPLAAAGYYYFNVPEKPRPAGRDSRRRTRPGIARFITEKFRLVDDTRTTPAHNGRPEKPLRELRGELWRPARPSRPAPLIVYSHGFMSSRREGLYLARFLASHGHTVVAVDYPLTGARARGKPHPGDIVNQPGDISCLIDHMLARNNDPADKLYETIDPGKIALAGVSYGGLTSLLTTYHRQWRDNRIAATVAIAAPTSMLSRDFFADNTTPTLMIYGDGDSLVRYEHHALPPLQWMHEASLVTLKKGSHAGFAQQGSTMLRFLRNPDSLACATLKWSIDKKPWDFVTDLGGAAVGIVQPEEDITPLTEPLIVTAMKASRQHMFTGLATHAFLESRFAEDFSTRRRAERFLQRTLPAENRREISVSC